MHPKKFLADLHVHSRYSGDNECDPEECVVMAIEAGLDAIAFTEHYYYDASEPAEQLKEKYGRSITILRGVEFSAEEGHCLVFGVNTDSLHIKNAAMRNLVGEINRKGGVVIPSHPFRNGSGIGNLIETVEGICAIEGYNGCNMYAFNAKAVEAAQRLNLPFTGGSDAHSPEEVGSCFTEFDDVVTEDNFILLLKNGKYRGIDTRKISRGWIF